MTYKDTFRNLKKKNKKAFIPFTVLGDPDFDSCIKIVKAMVDGGADILELGVPFSDPIADGPTIQAADKRAIDSGFNTDKLFKIIEEIRNFTNIPIGLLVYANTILQYGENNFFRRAKESETTGILVADMPIEESTQILKLSAEYDLETIFIVSPLTDNDRLLKIANSTTGFIYVISRLGVTGAQEYLQDDTLKLIKRISPVTEKPLCVGFGISKPEHVKSVCEAGADGAIVGSALVKIIEENLHNETSMLEKIKNYVEVMKKATLL